MRRASLLFLVRGGEICLALKKAGFGQGHWNGVGGKQEKGEDIVETARRETREEIGVEVRRLFKVGVLDFRFEGKSEWDQEVHVFIAPSWVGTPRESNEMRPRWFAADSLPFDQMWEDDRHWLPKILEGNTVQGRFYFDGDQRLVSHSIQVSGSWNRSGEVSKIE